MSASLASQIVALSGVGKFNRVDLGKKLAGKAVGVTPSIDGDDGGTHREVRRRKDLETLFQLAYLYFTAPRLDTAAMQAFRNQVGPGSGEPRLRPGLGVPGHGAGDAGAALVPRPAGDAGDLRRGERREGARRSTGSATPTRATSPSCSWATWTPRRSSRWSRGISRRCRRRRREGDVAQREQPAAAGVVSQQGGAEGDRAQGDDADGVHRSGGVHAGESHRCCAR